eukprot:TRINITY_DN506_c0_g1_i8.p2 TRINITY_DN506_c0_g1~~TRINITY_DN506_c0_g1_i8.p2  ORF type:complete len:204 (-),score=34.94 TRINITY_DN506_c0_g1_i8:160-771(-)
MLSALVNGFTRFPRSSQAGLFNSSLTELTYIRSFASKAAGKQTTKKVTKTAVKTVKKAAPKPEKPQKPKRVPSAFNLYVKDQYFNYQKGDAKAPQIMKQLAAAWKKLAEREKQPFQQQATKLKTQKEQLMAQKKMDKGPLSAYPQFVKDNFSKVRSQDPQQKASQVMIKLAGMWRDLSKAEKDTKITNAENAKKQFKLKKASA